MSQESYMILMYVQVLAFTLVTLALVYYYAAQHFKKQEPEEAEVDDIQFEIEPVEKMEEVPEIKEQETELSAETTEKPISELNYLDAIYEESHENKIHSVRLHGKHK